MSKCISESLDELEDEQLDAQLQLLARLLREGRLDIKVAVPRQGSWRIFHPKMGIFHDDDGNALSFEGSVNETIGGWKNNYERFKIHRSWVDQQSTYVDGDVDTFERLWEDEHPYVEVYDLPEAIEEELIAWKDPDSQTKLEEAIQISRGEAPPTERDKANIISDGYLSPGGLALAEQSCTITPWPHQRVVSDTLANTYPNSFLLCDEVGLGKTIETGLTLSRLGFTDELETGLLLVPASLTVQWQEELREKFNLNAYRYERGSNYEYVFIDAFGQEFAIPTVSDLDLDADEREQPWVESPIWRFLHDFQTDDGAQEPAIVIMSWHTARLTDRWNQVAPEAGDDTRTRDEVPASCRGRPTTDREGVWDVVVVDEAHNARQGSNFYSLLEQLRDHTQTYYLLTATPMQLHAGELHDLMDLLDLPGEWSDRDRFVDFFETRGALTTAVEAELDNQSPTPERAQPTQAAFNDARYQQQSDERTLSHRIFDRVAAQLDLDDEQHAPSIAKQRILRACDLASDFGEYYDGYIDDFDTALDDYDVDPFDAKEDDKLKYLLYPKWKVDDEWLMFSRGDRLDALDELSEAGWRAVQDVLASSTPVDALIHRNTRDTLRKYEHVGLLDTTVPSRNPKQRKIDLTDETRRVYDRIDEYTRKFYKLSQQASEADSRAIGFVMTTYRQRLTSSVYAISQSLQHRLETLRGQKAVLESKQRAADRSYGKSEQLIIETLDEDALQNMEVLDELEGDLENTDLAEVIPNVSEEGLNLLEQEIEELESFVDELTEIDQDPKISTLEDDLDDFIDRGYDRAVIFTQYTDTMDFIRESLISIHGETVATYSGRGGEMYDSESNSWTQVGKERVKREFADDDSQVDILVCTDSASEGLNLQECGVLINYDLPWNPMRVEQRIGRIDRIGQQEEEIHIRNYSYADTVETDIYDRLDDRINLFESVVGEMQPILSTVNQQIRSATLEADREQNQEMVQKADEEFSEQVQEQEESDRVDIGESLDSATAIGREDIIGEAKLDAWESYLHPDLVEVGANEYEHTIPFDTEALEAYLVGSNLLEAGGIEFTAVSDLSIEIDDAAFSFSERTYRLDHGERIDVLSIEDEGTLAQQVAPGEGAVAITFSTACADIFPSVALLAPGNQLLEQLLSIVREESDEPRRLSQKQRPDEETGTHPTVRGWGRNGEIVALSDEGGASEVAPTELLDDWYESFLVNRQEATETTDLFN